MGKKLSSFMKGLRNEHATLDEVLSGKIVDKKYRLIDLNRANVTYDEQTHNITINKASQMGFRAHITQPTVDVQINPAFHDYMQTYGDSVRYVTRNGTPWLTEQEQSDPRKVADYYEALKAGPKQDVAIINWRKTDGKDSGHSAVSVGKLAYDGDFDEQQPQNQRGIKEYEQHAGGSFYPSQSIWVDRKSRSTHMKQARDRDTGDDPNSHANGLLVRNSARPTAAAVGAGVATAALLNGGKKKKGGIIRTIIKGGAVATAAYTAGRVTNILQSSPGSILIKDEDRGHGVLATLVTDAQHDLMEHAIVGLGKTYHERYNLLKSNCADFAGDMMEIIGINTQELVQAAMDTEPACGKKQRRRPGQMVAPNHIRPDRNQWAIRQLEDGQEGVVTVDEQDICMRKLNISGQSALLIEEANGDMFKHQPLEMLSKILAEGVGVSAPLGPNRAEFAFSDKVKVTQQGVGRA